MSALHLYRGIIRLTPTPSSSGLYKTMQSIQTSHTHRSPLFPHPILQHIPITILIYCAIPLSHTHRSPFPHSILQHIPITILIYCAIPLSHTHRSPFPHSILPHNITILFTIPLFSHSTPHTHHSQIFHHSELFPPQKKNNKKTTTTTTKKNQHSALIPTAQLSGQRFHKNGHCLAAVLPCNRWHSDAHGEMVAAATDSDVTLLHLHHTPLLRGNDERSLDPRLPAHQSRLMTVDLGTKGHDSESRNTKH